MNLRRLILCVICLTRYDDARAEALTPSFFNLAEGKRITATATCGVDLSAPEFFCYANEDTSQEECDFCDPNYADKSHPAENAIDDTESVWRSPPLSRGLKYERVNLTVNLGQAFTVGYVILRPGRQGRPSVWLLEKSRDHGKTWSTWQYFASSESDCTKYFGVPANRSVVEDDSVICSVTRFDPETPDVRVPIISGRPSQRNVIGSPILQDWATATDVRLRFFKIEEIRGISKSARPNRYFYTIEDLKIGGRCSCNGHADSCEYFDSNPSNEMYCQCRHNTCGLHCDACCPGYEKNIWKPSTATETFVCQA